MIGGNKDSQQRDKDFKEYLHKKLRELEFARAYLNEALVDKDPKVFLLALKDVIEAQGTTMSSIARKAQINRQNLHRILSKSGNPRWDKVTSLFGALGFQMELSFKSK